MYKGKPVIGVMPLYDAKRKSYWMLPGYMQSLEAEGAIVLMPSLGSDEEGLDYFIDSCDGFLLTGGQDVDPTLYHMEKSLQCGEISEKRDWLDRYVLLRAVEKNKAVLGICRGVQLMNVVYGGTLYQDLPTEYASKIEHHMEPPYDRAVHQVFLQENTPLKELLQKEQLPVNSYHHQAVRELSPAFEVMAVSEDGLTEGIFMPDKAYVWGVQWHPELSYQTSEDSRWILRAFVKAAEKTAEEDDNRGNTERKQQLLEILKFRRETTYKYHKYLSTPREYYPGESMYMREVHVIMEIGEHGIDNVGELSERLTITRGAVSQYLKKLEEKGFVSRIQDGKDKRQFSVKLTKKGRELYQNHMAYDRQQYAKACPLFSQFTEAELDLVFRFDEKFKELSNKMLLEENGKDLLKSDKNE